MRTILTEKDVSDGKKGAYHAKNVSVIAQTVSSVTERRTPLTNGRAKEAKEGTTFAWRLT